MSFQSQLGRLPVFDDKSAHVLVDEANHDPKKGRGLIPRDYTAQPYGSVPYAVSLPLPTIPRDEWTERIEAGERTKSRIPDLCDAAGLKVKNQEQTNYCWINAPVHCLEVLRVVQGEEYVELSPASCGAKIKGFRNVGGWGTEGVEFLTKSGAVPCSLWPANAIDRRYDTPEANSEREKYQVDEWWECRPRDFDELATCLLLNVPVAIGLSFWGHEVTAVALVKLDGRDQYGVMFDNSWGENWGDKGRGVLTGSKMIPDDAIAPRVATAA